MGDSRAAARRFIFTVADPDTEHERRDGVVVREDNQRVDQFAERPTVAAFSQFLSIKTKGKKHVLSVKQYDLAPHNRLRDKIVFQNS
jgi:hypothetical protein